MMVVYKVVREIDSKLYSCFIKNEARVQYVPKEITKAPRGTALFAFEDKESAIAFIEEVFLNNGFTYELWSCTGKKSRRFLDLIVDTDASYDVIKRVWKGHKLNDWDMYEVPKGTVFMQYLKLEERLMRI